MELVRAHGIELVVDIRRYPMSRRNPQFNADALAVALRDVGIEYRHEPALGGRREPQADSPNRALKNDQFRGYADHMASEEFGAALERLLEDAGRRTAVMCAEALPWRCHRSMLADAVAVRGVEVRHILAADEARKHEVSPLARVDGSGTVTYPALV